MNTLDQLYKLKEKNRALCYRRKHLQRSIVSFKRTLENGCHDHRYIHKRLYEYIDEVELLNVLIDTNGFDITKLREKLKNDKIQNTESN